MKRKNMISMVTSLALVGVVAVGGTLALLVAPSNDVTNTFTVGSGYDQEDPNPDFILREHVVKQDTNGDYIENTALEGDDALTTTGTYANLVSNSNLFKDPFFILRNGKNDDTVPPDSWVIAKMDAGQVEELNRQNIAFADAGDTWYLVTATATGEGDEKTWTYSAKENGELNVLTAADLNNLDTLTNENTKFYFIYNTTISAGKQTNPLFENLSVGEAVPNTNVTLKVSGVAVEAVTGSNLNDNLQQIMEAAVSRLG